MKPETIISMISVWTGIIMREIVLRGEVNVFLNWLPPGKSGGFLGNVFGAAEHDK